MINNIAIFASGNGTNAQRISEYFDKNPLINVSLILTNNKNAFVIERAKQLNIPYLIFSKSELEQSNIILEVLKEKNINWIILAGFLLKIPDYLIKSFPKHIINIHPALLPKYGGKGMYGDIVHKEVIAHKEFESGITIHYVNEIYDEGEIIFQVKTNIDCEDTPETLAKKIHLLEYEYFPEIIKEAIETND